MTMSRLVFKALTALSTVLLVVTLTFWVRSYLGVDRALPTWPVEFTSVQGRINLGLRDAMTTDMIKHRPFLAGFFMGFTRHWLPVWAYVPHWLVAGVSLVLPACAYFGRRRRLRRARAGYCPACGYDLRASPGACPECGSPPAGAAAPGVGSSAPSR